MTDPIAEEYRSSLSELNFNSKPHINMLTMLAEENAPHAAVIVQTIVDHINSVTPDIKLPSLYLVDSIAKNIGKVYIPLFSKHLVALFTSVFEKVDENIRSLLYKLRQTWTGLFPNNVLLQLDRSVVCLDPAWPILAKPQIHFNPKFLKDKAPVQLPEIEEPSPSPAPQNTSLEEVEMKKRQLLLLQALHQKKKELITLQLKKALASPTISDGVKEDAKKIINTRDPRLSKKMASTTQSDSAVLQSVVVIPKVNKRNEKEPTTSSSKKIKLDSDSSPKKDLKNKSESMEVDSSSKLNVELNTQIASSISAQVQNGDRSKKQSFSSENSSELITKSPFQQNTDFNKESLPVNSVPARPNELIKIKNNIVSQTSVNEENKYLFKSQPVVMTNEDTCHKNIQKLDSPPSPPLFLGNEDRDYRMLPKNINERSLKESSYSKRPAVPVVKSFILDKKERKVYFVNDRSFALMDDNVPKELTFEGPPKLVFIEGLTQPIELAFGQEVEFEVDGKCNFMKFGTPSREVYINDYPFEAQFGGSSFTAMLSNGKIHRIHISGPPPHVVLSESPSYELYEKFCQNNKEFLCKLDNESIITNDDLSTDTTVGTRDVDMRMNNVKSSSAFFHFPLERMQNVDWQRIPVDNMQEAKWNVPKNSFESFKDVEQNFTVPKTYSQGPEWQNPHPLPEIQSAPLNPPPLPPKQMINRFPLPPHTYRNIDVNNTISMNQFSMNEHPRLLPPCNVEQPRFTANSVEQHIFLPPNNVPFSQANFSSNEFSVNRPDLNMVINCNIPRLSPPPLPPFIGPIQNASGVPNVSSASTSTPFSNPVSSTPLLPTPIVSSAPLHPAPIFSSSPLLATPVVVSSSLLLPTPTSAPLINLPSLQPMTRLSAPLPINNFINTTQVPSYTVPENVPRFTATPSSTAPSATSATSDMQLFMEKLKAAGLIKSDLSTSSTPVSTASTTSEPETKEEEKKDELPKEQTIPEITLDSKCLREYHPGVIAAIYCGSMCATCGIRFKEIQSEQYSRHLDWHFRRNRREKDGAKKPFSRRWFYEIKDWIEFKEFEDKDERAPSYFELQANSEQIEEEPENVCSVSCSECDSEICAVCDEQFQLFWVEEAEEWHLRNCVKHDDQVYHPACYEDFKKANEPVPDAEMSFDDSTIDIKPTDSTTDNKPDVAELNLDVKVKTEVMDVDINIKTEMMDIDSDIKQEPMDVNDNVIKKDVQPILGKKSEMIDSGMKSKIEKLKLGEKSVIKKLNSKEKQMEVAEHSRNKVVKLVENKVKKEVKIKEVKPSEIKEIKPSEMKEVKPSEIKEVKPSEIKTIKEVKSTEIKSDKNKIGKEVKSTEVKLNEHKTAKVVKSTEIKTNQNKIITEVKISEVKSNESRIVKEVKNTEVKQNESKIVKEVKNTEVKPNENKVVKEVKSTEVKPNENKVVKEVKSTEVKPNENKVVNEMKIKDVKLNENKIVEVKVKEVKSDENRIVKEVTKNVKLEKQVEKTEKIEENKIEKEVRTEEKKVEETKSQEVLDGKCDKRIEKSPTESMTSEKAKEPSETIKEPVKGDETHTDIKNNFKTDISSTETNSNVSPTVSSKTDVKSQSSSHSETVPTKPEDELEDIEFRPPIPDPRFEVLPPVSRGTEISNLCTIM